MEHIENALIAAGAADWEGAEIGSGEVNFGFSVEDFDLAEATVRQAVKSTPFANIREISRREFSEEDFVNTETDIKPLGFFGLIGLLLFKRMPKRFRDN